MGELSEQNRALVERAHNILRYDTMTADGPLASCEMTEAEPNRLLDAARTEGRGEGEPVAWRHEYRPGRYHLSTVAQEGYQPLYASPIREPEISEETVKAARDLSNRLRGRYAVGPIMPNGEPEFGYRQFDKMPDGKVLPAIHGEAADMIDAILNLAPVGGRGEGCSSRSQPVLSPKSDTEGPSADGSVRRPPYVFHSLSACAGCGCSGDYFPAPDAKAYEVTGELYCDECAEEAIALAQGAL